MGLNSQEAMAALFDEAEAPAPAQDEAPATVEAAPEPVEAAQADAAPVDVETPAAVQRDRDEAGKFIKAQVAKAKAAVNPLPVAPKVVKPKPVAAVAPAVVPAAVKPAPVAPPLPTAPELRAPTGWKATAREHWGKLPPEVQQEALRRDKEAAVLMTRATEAERRLAPVAQTFAQHAALVQAHGGNPLAVADQLMRQQAVLTMGPPEAKAQVLATLIRNSGLTADQLAASLDAAPTHQQGQQRGAGQHFDPDAMARQVAQQVHQQLAAERQQRTQGEYMRQMETFAQAHEFFGDVREDMAYILEDAHRRGLSLTTEQAYTRACQLHPDIAPVMQQREAAKLAAANAAKIQRSRAASSSVKGQPAMGNPSGAQPMSRREVLEAAWDAAEGG